MSAFKHFVHCLLLLFLYYSFCINVNGCGCVPDNHKQLHTYMPYGCLSTGALFSSLTVESLVHI